MAVHCSRCALAMHADYEDTTVPYGRTRWVEYPTPPGVFGIELRVDPSMISPEWHGWMHYMHDKTGTQLVRWRRGPSPHTRSAHAPRYRPFSLPYPPSTHTSHPPSTRLAHFPLPVGEPVPPSHPHSFLLSIPLSFFEPSHRPSPPLSAPLPHPAPRSPRAPLCPLSPLLAPPSSLPFSRHRYSAAVGEGGFARQRPPLPAPSPAPPTATPHRHTPPPSGVCCSA